MKTIETDLILNKMNNAEEVQRLVNEFESYSRKSSETSLHISRITFSAKQNLNGNDFCEFVKKIGFGDSNSTVSKLIKIGGKFDVLSPISDNLPANWTTLYYIAGIPESDLKDFIECKQIHCLVSGAEVKAILKELKPSKNKATPSNSNIAGEDELSIICKTSVVLNSEERERLKVIIDNLKELQFEVETSPELTHLIESD